MEHFNGIDLVLLLGLLASLFYIAHLRGTMSLVWLDGFMAGTSPPAQEHPTSHVRVIEPYDYKKEGL